MTEMTFRAVLRRDEKTKRYEPAGHNFSPQKAEEQAAHLQNEGFDAAVVPQEVRHSGRGFKNCEPCKKSAENLSGQQPEVSEEDTEHAPAENS